MWYILFIWCLKHSFCQGTVILLWLESQLNSREFSISCSCGKRRETFYSLDLYIYIYRIMLLAFFDCLSSVSVCQSIWLSLLEFVAKTRTGSCCVRSCSLLQQKKGTKKKKKQKRKKRRRRKDNSSCVNIFVYLLVSSAFISAGCIKEKKKRWNETNEKSNQNEK